MATAKSDDDSEQRQHPLANDRPGVYVHVVGAPRRRGARAASGEVAIDAKLKRESASLDAPPSDAITVPGETIASEIEAPGSEQVRRSGISFERSEAATPEVVPSENTNHRADLVIVHLPAPPRVPSVSLGGSPLPDPYGRSGSGSLLDAPHSLRPETLVPRSGPSWLMLGGVSLLSAIIAAAIVVAVRQPAQSTVVPVVRVEPAAPAKEKPESGFARYVAEDAARQKAAQEAALAAEAASRVPQAAPGSAPQAKPAALPALASERARKPVQPVSTGMAPVTGTTPAKTPAPSLAPPPSDTGSAGKLPKAPPAGSVATPVSEPAAEPKGEVKESVVDTLPANPYEQ